MHTETHQHTPAPFPLTGGPASSLDVSETALDAGFRFPTYLSHAVGQLIAWDNERDSARKHCYDETMEGRIWSLLWMALLAVQKKPNADSTTFSCRIIPRLGSTRQSETETFRIRCSTASNGDPILFISTLWED